jgi:hypothetical protein
MKEEQLQLKIENIRKSKGQTDFFLYDIENYLLCGVSLDRTKNKSKSSYLISENEKFKIGVNFENDK